MESCIISYIALVLSCLALIISIKTAFNNMKLHDVIVRMNYLISEIVDTNKVFHNLLKEIIKMRNNTVKENK